VRGGTRTTTLHEVALALVRYRIVLR